MDKLCAWIDLVVPFCDDYCEANAWSDKELGVAYERLGLRKRTGQIERQSIKTMLGPAVSGQ